MSETPPIPILHHLARSGGTLISKCLGSMPKVLLLSEIHPWAGGQAMRPFGPLHPAHDWFGLVEASEVRTLESMDPGFAEAIAMLARRARARGKTLVLREWSHLDYMGAPWIEHPPMTSVLTRVLHDAGLETRHAFTTRHPADQWLSLRRLAVIHGALRLEAYLRGCAAFAEAAGSDGLRYEQFCVEPAPALKRMCGSLGVRYDPAWMDGWRRYTTITGDTTGSRGGTGPSAQIRPLTRRAVDPDLAARFLEDQNYQAACVHAGYSP
ncbi:MAG: hypothetical protein AAGK04_04555 [Planctomycetota bacterium]